MSKEIELLVKTLDEKVNEGIKLLKKTDVTTETYTILLNNILQSSNIVKGIKDGLEMLKRKSEERIEEEVKDVSN